MPVNFESIDLDLSPAFNSSNAKQAYDELTIFCASIGYKLEDRVFTGSAEPHNFCCDKGHKIKMRPASLINGSRCLECYKKSNWISVICTNGKVYESANKAAVDLKVDNGSVYSALKNKHFIEGYLVAELSSENYKKCLENPRHLESTLLALKRQENERRRHRMPLVTSAGKIYLSQSAAAIDFNCKPSQVSAALSRVDSTIGGVGVVALSEEKYYELVASAEKLSNFVASQWSKPPARNQSKRKSIISSDGNWFDSVGSCAAFFGVSISCISSKITSGKPIKGITLKFSDGVANKS
jgi:hypothetical protein